MIANAGISSGTSGADGGDVAKLRKVLEVNVAGLAATLAAFAPAMREAGRGTLAGIASVAGFRGLAGNGAYCASKSAAITWLESLRAELYGSGVSVVCVCPGYIDTPMTRVNRFRMPFLISADDAARRIARAIENKRRAGGDSLADGAGVGAVAGDARLAVRPDRLARPGSLRTFPFRPEASRRHAQALRDDN